MILLFANLLYHFIKGPLLHVTLCPRLVGKLLRSGKKPNLVYLCFPSATRMGNGGKVGKLDPKKRFEYTYNRHAVSFLLLACCVTSCVCIRVVNKMDKSISGLVAKISSNSTAGHT